MTRSGAWVIVDGVLGTGIAGAARGAVAAVIQAINAAGERHTVVAIDVPSGLNADTGIPAGAVVRADLTVTMGLPKRGLLMPAAVEFVGRLVVADIGIPAALTDPLATDVELIVPADVPQVWRRRSRATHKGSYGHVLLLGGSPGYAGAIALAARAALRSGVGLVSVLTPASVATLVAGWVPEAMVHAGAETDAGTLATDCLTRWGRDAAGFDAVVLGPGLGINRYTTVLVERVLAAQRGTLVLDADALNAIAHRLFLAKRAGSAVILTPHPGEMARLLHNDVATVQADRFRAAAMAAEAALGAVVVLKGAGTLVARAGRTPCVNLTGNPGMAKGGVGDVLAGLMGGLCAQGHDAFDAARAAVYLHGRAGDLAAARLSQSALTAGDVIDALPNAILDACSR
jgi:NAD(P)H-hydrate epimerase